jgi:D-beta-D-heptose 7-phosphate kinase/D-beta-D-heptose 1-phosphate adenosyltransferase
MKCELNTILNLVNDAKQQNRTIVFTNGCFDIIHSGHCKYLSEAKKLGDVLIVGLNTDNSIKRLKGNDRPINSQADRAFVLSSLRAVDYVVLFDEDTPLELIKAIRPDVLVKGKDYAIDEIVGAKEVISCGGRVETIELVAEKSTTNIINKLKNKNCNC